MSDLIGRIVGGRYRVEDFLGKGGMAEVYKVWDQERNVHLAMKILHADLAEDRVFLRRFKREAQTLAKLQHPNIVRFYGLEQGGDLVYMLMDYVDGTSLRKEIFQAKAPLSMERIVEVMKSVCSALYYAHKLGFVHCDIKPANIMIHKNGTVYVADFGIARMTEASTVTMVGAGTPAYMAPEQARGEDPLPQTDIYALGIVLFEMLTGGERPFTGESAKTTGSTSEKVRWEQIKLAPPPPSKYNSSISPDMDVIVLKCLDKTPSNRYLSATDLFGELVMQVNTPLPPKPAPAAVINLPQVEQQQPVTQSKAPAVVVQPVVNTMVTQNNIAPTRSRNTRFLRAVGAIGIGILIILAIITGISAYYQGNMNTIIVAATTSVSPLFSSGTSSRPTDTSTYLPTETHTPIHVSTETPFPTNTEVPTTLPTLQKGSSLISYNEKISSTGSRELGFYGTQGEVITVVLQLLSGISYARVYTTLTLCDSNGTELSKNIGLLRGSDNIMNLKNVTLPETGVYYVTINEPQATWELHIEVVKP